MEQAPAPTRAPGIYDIPSEEYHSGPGLSKGALDLIHRSPRHYEHVFLKKNRPEPTPAMIIGSALHCAVLEPEKFPKLYVDDAPIAGIDGRTKEGKLIKEQFAAEHAGKTILKARDFDVVLNMRDSIMLHEQASQLVSGGQAEQSAYWEDPRTGILCRARPDYKKPEHGILVDVKTCENASLRKFEKQVADHRYHVQGAFYLDGVSRAEQVRYKHFLFVAVEKTPPFEVAIYLANEAMLDQGKIEIQQDMDVYAECVSKNEWPGYSRTIQEIGLPAWAWLSF